MKQLGIITFHCANNYGAVLQCFALKKFCEKNVTENVSVINYCPQFIDGAYRFWDNYYIDTFKKNKRLFIKLTAAYILKVYPKMKKIRQFNCFRRDKLSVKGQKIASMDELFDVVRDYDVILLGSDQIWNPEIADGFDRVYLGDIGNSKAKLISYAASAGISAERAKKYDWQTLCKKISAIGVREKTFAQVLEDQGLNVTVNIDPVFLLSKSEWEANISDIKCKYSNFILYYSMEHNTKMEKILKDIKEKTQYKVVEIIVTEKCRYSDIGIDSVDPLAFVKLISSANIVVTNSFHATAFSIIFQKNFYTIPHTGRNSRIADLLDGFDLSNRLITEPLTEYDMICYSRHNTEHIIICEQKKAKEFLPN